MHAIQRKYTMSAGSFIALLIAQLFCASPARAETEMSNQPLILNVTAEPNVLMILDNSQSMASETLPEDFFNVFRMDYALPSVGSTTFLVPDYNDENIFNLAVRTSSLNRLYYDPSVKYRTWSKADGTNYAASPATAAPIEPGSSTTLNLTAQDTRTYRWRRNVTATTFVWSSSSLPTSFSCGGSSSCSLTFWPITFFVHKGTGSIYERENYYRYRIQGDEAYRKDMATGDEVEIESFTWGSATRTIAEEAANFANWFTFGRTRINAAKNGASYAFSTLGKNYRVGYRTINGTSNWLSIPTNGTFSDDNRNSFFSSLFSTTLSGSTPLRTALKGAGEYFATAAPWGPDVGGAPLACRQSFAILTSDGYYNDALTGFGNVDENMGPPYEDDESNTLADVAMYYYDIDLQPDIDDKVPEVPEDKNTRQHMNTFTVAFGLQGSLNPETDLPRLTSGEISWPSTSTDLGKLDDMWHAAINGRGKFVNAADPQKFAEGLKDALDSIVLRTASSSNLGVSSAQLRQGSSVFQARFTSEVWTGDIWAFVVDANGDIPDTPSWKASENVPEAASRRIYTRNGSTGVNFLWDELSTEQKAALENDSAVLDFLRGVKTGETSNGGTFRNRSSVIGDIVHSSPVFVTTPEDRGYERFSWTGASTYQDYRDIRSTRTPMLYVAANDGMLHAFEAATGIERFAYVPSSALAQMYKLSQASYSHQFINDGSLTVGEVYDGGTSASWRSVLVGSTGRGGRQLYALDVSDPAIPSTNAPQRRVMWEFSDSDFGRFTGKPVIGRMNNGSWAVLVGNGYNSDQYRGFLFVVDALTGSLISKIGTGSCVDCISNGLTEVTPWDDDNDGDIDFVYAGDLRGNLWRFDVSSSTTTEWKVSFGSSSSPLPLFRALDASGKAQPITSRIEVLLDPSTATRWVSFGTGRFLGTSDRASTDIQTWYGLYDNYLSSETTPVSGRSVLAQRAVLVETTQTATGDEDLDGDGDNEAAGETVKVRVISAPGDDVGGDAVTDADGNYVRAGWYLDLLPPGGSAETAEGERMIYGVQAFGGALFATSAIPAADPCTPGGNGWLIALNPYTGGRLDSDLFVNRDQVTVSSGESTVSYYVSAISTRSMPSSPILVRNEGSSSGTGGSTGGSTGGQTGGDGDTGGGETGGGNEEYAAGRSDALVNTSDLGILRERLNLPDSFGRISWRELLAE